MQDHGEKERRRDPQQAKKAASDANRGFAPTGGSRGAAGGAAEPERTDDSAT